MFVNSLISDNAARSSEGVLTWMEIAQAIRELDGNNVTEVSIARRETESHMSITGGPAFFMVAATLDNDVFYDIINHVADSAIKVRLRAGGESVTVGMDEVVDLETALAAAQCFAQHGDIDPSKSWSRNPEE